jgi:hypothetical protein
MEDEMRFSMNGMKLCFDDRSIDYKTVHSMAGAVNCLRTTSTSSFSGMA